MRTIAGPALVFRASLVSTIGMIIFTGLTLSAAAATATAAGPTLTGCPVFPANNIWNTPIDTLPVSPSSAAYINSIGATRGLHADFGAGLWDGGPIGIPYVVVSGSQPKVAVTFDYADESDPGPYPIPASPPIEGGPSSTGDRHVLVLDSTNGILYELWSAYPQANGTWHAGSGAIFNLNSNQLRPDGWTSSDAAGLPVLPGLVRYDEVLAGSINHAIRFTIQTSRKAYVWPARHYASSNTSTSVPPMGQRFRLRSSFDVSSYAAHIQVILNAMKKYGIIVADNGSNWYISGAPDERWNNDELATMSRVKGSDFEAVDVSGLMVSANSGQASGQPAPAPASPNPANGQANVVVTRTLSWDGGGPAAGGITYDVYCGAGSLPATATATGLTAGTFNPGLLHYATAYYWKVVARSGASQTSSPVWTFQTPMTGDTNGDGHVNVLDLLTMAKAWNTHVGDGTYDPACDFGGDGNINQLDLLSLAGNWGK